jgi:hypothetical protein
MLNIDSRFRNIYPKNICISDSKLLPNNPLTFIKNSSIVKINYPNHGLTVGDNIVIQNVEGFTKILSNPFYLINSIKYVLVYMLDNNISSDYKLNNTIEQLFMNIETVGYQSVDNIINNLPFNYLTGVKQTLISSDIPALYLQQMKPSIQNILTELGINYTDSTYDSILESQFIFFELPFNYLNQDKDYLKIQQVFKISYLHIGGIKLGYINSNYPIDNNNYQSSQAVSMVIDSDNFEIQLNYKSYGDLISGGKNIQIMKIINTITGYPDADNYVIKLKKSFSNVTKIKLISTEFPYVDIAVQRNVNDKLFWKNIEDGDYIYEVQIDEGFYTGDSLLNKLKEKINQVKRITSTEKIPVFNYFDIVLEANTQQVIFNPYTLTKIPNSLSLRLETIDQDEFYVLNVVHPNNIVDQNDVIELQSGIDVTIKQLVTTTTGTQEYAIQSMNATYINKTHLVYKVNKENQTYDIIIGKKSEVDLITAQEEAAGGENLIVKSKTKVSFLFDRPNTLGEVLGFKNVGQKFSITEFSDTISNKDSYPNSNNLDPVGNEYTYTSGFFNLSGKYNYYLMYLNNIEYFYSNNNQPSAFGKILLSGNPGDILFNTFVPVHPDIYSKEYPIPTLTDLNIRFTNPDGSRVNFRNIEHSFTLEIIEEQIQNDDTYLNSGQIAVSEEFKKAIAKNVI